MDAKDFNLLLENLLHARVTRKEMHSAVFEKDTHFLLLHVNINSVPPSQYELVCVSIVKITSWFLRPGFVPSS